MRLKIACLIAGWFLSISPLAVAEVTDLQCEQTGPSEYKLSYSFTEDSHKVRILASTDAAGKSRLEEITMTGDTSVSVRAGAPGQRMYFFLLPDHGHAREVSIRHLPLEGTPNFRDLGGYETTDGRFVRWGLLYRSGVLTQLTNRDFAYLTPLGIRVVCDFRTSQENATNPEIWIPNLAVQHVSLPIGSGTNKKDAMAAWTDFLKTNPSPEQMKAHMTAAYGEFALTNAPEYAKVFAELKQEDLPLLFHCTAGKDRTGVFSALLLLTLGVPEKTVLEDYALTDKYLLHAMSDEATRKMLANASNPTLARLSPDQRRVMMAADPDYLRSTLRRINEKYGSFDRYRREALGVSDDDMRKLRARLLTD